MLTKTGDGEEWKTAAAEQLQADWNQNDRTAKDYIKNRPFYSKDETMVSSSYVDVLDSELNEMIEIPDNMNLIANMRWYKPFPFLVGSGKKMFFHIIIHISGQSSDIHNKTSMSLKENWSVIGGDNWKWDLGNTKNENFLLFFYHEPVRAGQRLHRHVYQNGYLFTAQCEMGVYLHKIYAEYRRNVAEHACHGLYQFGH